MTIKQAVLILSQCIRGQIHLCHSVSERIFSGTDSKESKPVTVTSVSIIFSNQEEDPQTLFGFSVYSFLLNMQVTIHIRINDYYY